MSNFIQEILGLIKREKTKTTLDPEEDWFEFGKLTNSTLNTGFTASWHGNIKLNEEIRTELPLTRIGVVSELAE